MKTWTSRRRLLTALAGKIPDRVPINTYELAGRDSTDWYNQQPSYRGLMEYIRAHTDCITNWNPRPATNRYTCEERFLCSDFPVAIDSRTERAGQFDPARGPARPWLGGIVRFAALDAARARGREVLTDDPDLGDSAVEPEAFDRLSAAQDGARLPVGSVRRRSEVELFDGEIEIHHPGRKHLAKHAPGFRDAEFGCWWLLRHERPVSRLMSLAAY